jgi:transcriptional regulator with XRE-family HTH domain
MAHDIGVRLRQVRLANGLSQRALAKKTGVSNATISLIESNKLNPSVSVLKRILAGRNIQILHEHYQRGADTGKLALEHPGEEGGVVIRGRLKVTVGDERHVLGPGDAYYFDSRRLQHFRNVGTECCEVVSACTPPSF